MLTVERPPMREGWELLIDPPMPRRAIRFMDAMAAAKPEGAVVTSAYQGKRRQLMLYGPGALRRLPIIKAHLQKGGRVAMWDLGYWNRETAMRLSIDQLHPSADLLDMAPEGARREFELREDGDPGGPILLIGLGDKSVLAYGLRPLQWEAAKLQELKRRYPGREIIWRPKGRRPHPLGKLRMDAETPIENLLKGASLVACRHSNVAVDACVAGVSVDCQAGAAVALYRDNTSPKPEQRAEFLRKLSWWEWDKHEALQAWSWCNEVTCSTSKS